MVYEKHILNQERGSYVTRLTFEKRPSMPNVEKRPAVLVCPGGGYMYCCPREGDPVAFQYMAQGYNTFVLEYSCGENAVFPNSLLDLCAAMKLIRENAEQWGVIEDQIAVLGFSAGGHLAASLGVYWNDPEIMERSGCKNGENKPNALILIYPVISTSWMENQEQLARVIGENDWESTYKKLNLQTSVGAHTPPAFLCHTARDAGVPCKDSIYFATAMLDAGVPCELHIFPNGGHGMSLGTPQVCTKEVFPNQGDKSFAQWVELSVNWLERLFANPEESAEPMPKDPYSSKY
jgi:acetyl esterase/lipase